MKKHSSHIILIGFQGAGKTTLGNRLATTTESAFIDIDEVIQIKHGPHIATIKDKGIHYFRELEVTTIKGILTNQPPSIIAFGGGAFLDERTRANIKKAHALTVFIDRPFQSMWNATHISGGERETGPMTLSYEQAKEVYATRLPLYQLADLHLWSDMDDSVDDTFKRLVDFLSRETNQLKLK